MASNNSRRDIQSSKPKTKLTLLNVLDETLNFSAISPKRRRQTIHGREIKKIRRDAELPEKRRLTRSSSITNVSSPLSSTSSSASSSIMVLPNRSSFVPGVIKGSLKRRVSTSLLKHKMKRLQDYSLAPTAQDLALFKDTCNITTRSSPRISSNTNNNNQPQPSSTPLPPAKPPRQRPPKNLGSLSFSQKLTTAAVTATPIANENSSPVWKKRELTMIKKRVRKDQDLQQKIDHEIKMREGTARLLSASKHPAQVLEAAKNLLSYNTRIMAYMTELQRRKTAEVLGKQTCLEGNQVPCRAQVSVSDIRIPLMWKDTDHFKNKGDYRRYAVFCLLKVGTDIYDTSMITGVDRSMTDITFEDVILFEEVPHDFEMQLEVYCHKQHEELSVANTPKKIRKKITDLSGSVGRSVGKRLSGLNDSDVIGNMVLGPKFELVAKGSLHLSSVDSSVKTFDLQLEANSDGHYHELPLFGHYCCRLAALPSCLVQATVSGFLNLQEEDDDLTQWRRYWCSLKNLQIACWSSPDDVEVTKPLLRIPVTKSTQISDADPSTCKQAHTFLIKTVNTDGIFDHTLAADSKEDLNKWWDGLQQHLLDQAFWKHACDTQMDLKTVSKRKVPSFVRKSSIYDETPLIDPDSQQDSLVGDLGLGDDQLSRMLHQLMGEASQIRGGGGGGGSLGGGSCSSTSS